MTQAQALYNTYIVRSVICESCGKSVSFQSIVDWGPEVGSFRCPYCKVIASTMIGSEARDACKRMAHLDLAIIKQLLQYAKEGQLHNHEPADATQWACLCMIAERASLLCHPMPLSYIHRMFLIQLYRQLVEADKMPKIDIYAILAPIPVEVVIPKVGPLTHSITSAKKKAKTKKKKEKSKPIEDIFSFGAAPKKKKKKKAPATLDDLFGL